MVTYAYRDGVDQHAAAELDDFNDELQAALLMSISECIISWTTCVPGFWKCVVYGGARWRWIIYSDESEGKGTKGRVNQSNDCILL